MNAASRAMRLTKPRHGGDALRKAEAHDWELADATQTSSKALVSSCDDLKLSCRKGDGVEGSDKHANRTARAIDVIV